MNQNALDNPNEKLYNRRKELCAARVTLDGRPATVSGAMFKFAEVRSLDGVLRAEFAWSTVENVIANSGGAFKN